MNRNVAIFAALSIVGLAGWAHAQSTPAGTVKLPQNIEYKGLAGTPLTAVLYGDPTKPGFYVSRLKLAPGMKIPPHWHPEELRTVVVLSGTLYFGLGEQWDDSKLTAYPAGTFFSEAPKTPHFVWAKDGEVVLQFTAIGPTGRTDIPQK